MAKPKSKLVDGMKWPTIDCEWWRDVQSVERSSHTDHLTSFPNFETTWWVKHRLKWDSMDSFAGRIINVVEYFVICIDCMQVNKR